ncbi:bis(5'-adenosyl)-triphosphatase, partial [Phenoliferia sp. Uapishka_3]
MSLPFRFASFAIPNQVFYQSALSLGLVNLKPLVPGHVLVIPKRIIPRFGDLTTEEVSDLFLSVQTISRVIESEYKAASMTIACQDGPLAGQSVPHTHIHIMPRHGGDFQPLDAVYEALDNNNFQEDYKRRQTRAERLQERQEKGVDAGDERKARTEEEMRNEAMRLSQLFPEEVRGRFEG